MRRWGLAAALSIVGLARTALAADAPEPPIGMITPGGPHFECGREWATPIAFRDLMSNIESWIGRCVRVRGITQGYFFFGDLPDLYRATSADPETHERRGPRMGLYAKDDAMREHLFRYRQEVEVVAMAHTCARWREWKEKEFDRQDSDHRRLHPPTPPLDPEGDKVERVRVWMFTGCCHYTDDPVLLVAEVRHIKPGPQRLVGEEANRAHGDLETFPPTAKDYAEVLARLTRWFDALRRRNGDELLSLTEGVGSNDLKTPGGLLYDLLNRSDSGARFLFGRRSLPRLQLFRVREASDGLAMACACKTKDCTATWPIHSSDANAVRSWPYLCMWIRRDDDGRYVIGD